MKVIPTDIRKQDKATFLHHSVLTHRRCGADAGKNRFTNDKFEMQS